MYDQQHDVPFIPRQCQNKTVNMLAHVLLSLRVFKYGFIQIRFGIFEFFARYLFNSILHGIISLRTQFFIDEKHTQ